MALTGLLVVMTSTDSQAGRSEPAWPGAAKLALIAGSPWRSAAAIRGRKPAPQRGAVAPALAAHLYAPGTAKVVPAGVKPIRAPMRMGAMSENSPDPTMNGHAGALTESAGPADGRGAAAEGHAGTDGQAAAEPGRSAVVDDLCRLTVCGPAKSVELAVPVHVPLIDLLPALVGHLGDDLADAGLEHGGWVLQRLGDPPLREDLSIAALGLHDGDVVHLRPRSDQLPPPDFDDLIDG